MTDKEYRLGLANAMIVIIASCGRKFLSTGRVVSYLELDSRGRIWYFDSYSEKKIYTHYTSGSWRGFSDGGTLRDVIIRLRDFVVTGKLNTNTFGPWPEWYSGGDPWGYGDDMAFVSKCAKKLFGEVYESK